ERLTDALRKGPDLLRDGALVRKREEAQLSALAAPDGVRMDCAETVRHAVEHVRLKAAAAQPRREHVRVVECQALRHFPAPLNPVLTPPARRRRGRRGRG